MSSGSSARNTLNSSIGKSTLARHAGWITVAILLSGCGGSGSSASTSAESPTNPATTPNANQAPQITSSPQGKITVTAGDSFYEQAQASDADGDTLTFTIENKPAWAVFDTGTGVLRGNPTSKDVGTYSDIVISVSDGNSTTRSTAFEVIVDESGVTTTNRAPTLSGTAPSSVNAGSSYYFRPTANDADGDTLSFSVQNLPAWASFDTRTGALSGTPTNSDIGLYGNIVISVSDGTHTTRGSVFEVTVIESGAISTNHAPSLSGTAPGSVNAGSNYTFRPTANDADGDTLTFSVQNLPAWAGFDAATGTLSGTPGDADIGLYTNIVISVSDGSLETTGPAFSIQVNQISLGSATLSWTAPTQNMDGSTLTDLAGFKLYYGTNEGNYTEQITVDNPGISTYVVDNLAPDTYYFVATAYNGSGVESPYSGVAVKTVQ